MFGLQRVNFYPVAFFFQPLDMENPISWPPWVEIVTNISHLLTSFNSSVNFYIYLFKHYKTICGCTQGQGERSLIANLFGKFRSRRPDYEDDCPENNLEMLEIEVDAQTMMQETTMSLLSANGGTSRHSSASSSSNSATRIRSYKPVQDSMGNNLSPNIIVNGLANSELDFS